MIDQLNELLDLNQYEDFFTILPKITSELSEEERQRLLVDIIDFHYDHRLFANFKNSFDLIISSGLNLNYSIDHWAPTLLSLVILRAPLEDLFMYFVEKGADLNYIGDTYAFEDKEYVAEEYNNGLGRYITCLDFAQLKLNDLLTSDYMFDVPENKMNFRSLELPKDEDTIALSKKEYLYLQEQSEYLFDVIGTEKIQNYIIGCGGKKYTELKLYK